jgi:hypothetical protein
MACSSLSGQGRLAGLAVLSLPPNVSLRRCSRTPSYTGPAPRGPGSFETGRSAAQGGHAKALAVAFRR